MACLLLACLLACKQPMIPFMGLLIHVLVLIEGSLHANMMIKKKLSRLSFCAHY